MTDLPPPDYSDLDLPSYDTLISAPTPATAAVNPTTKSVLGPATLYISGRFVYSTDPQAPPLYEFSHSIGYLHDHDRSVKVERVDSVIKTSAGLPQVALKTATSSISSIQPPPSSLRFPTMQKSLHVEPCAPLESHTSALVTFCVRRKDSDSTAR
ncbi:hypothetical protein NXS19_007523 [Fusarium pseudograminearum]|nr:hypothetical protein NXS19_007523 [Fusarium pseudograminearum]